MRQCTGPVSCLPVEVVEKPDGLLRGGEAYLPKALSHPAGNASFIHSFLLPCKEPQDSHHRLRNLLHYFKLKSLGESALAHKDAMGLPVTLIAERSTELCTGPSGSKQGMFVAMVHSSMQESDHGFALL